MQTTNRSTSKTDQVAADNVQRLTESQELQTRSSVRISTRSDKMAVERSVGAGEP